MTPAVPQATALWGPVQPSLLLCPQARACGAGAPPGPAQQRRWCRPSRVCAQPLCGPSGRPPLLPALPLSLGCFCFCKAGSQRTCPWASDKKASIFNWRQIQPPFTPVGHFKAFPGLTELQDGSSPFRSPPPPILQLSPHSQGPARPQQTGLLLPLLWTPAPFYMALALAGPYLSRNLFAAC